jgi:two-component system sensor histidine kinase RegB
MTPLRYSSERDELKAQWLIRVRWGAVAAWSIIGFSCRIGFGSHFQVAPLFWFIGLTVVTNLTLQAGSLKGVAPFYRMAVTILADIILLAGLLFCYGGYTNPFSTMFLVYVTLAAFLLNARWTWWAFLLSGAAFSGLFFWHIPLESFDVHHHGGGGFSLHLSGMLAAFFVIGFLLSLFLTAMSRELDQQAEQIRLLEEKRTREEKFLSVATLAAGAAHELSTPIATLSLICEDLTMALKKDERWGADVTLMQEQLKRCEGILNRMRGGDSYQYEVEQVTPALIGERIRAAFPGASIDVVTSGDAFDCELEPLVAAAQSVVKNAVQASAPAERISVKVFYAVGSLTLEVTDKGAGMEQDVVARAGDPFFTTKVPGEGLGLGLFLVRSYVSRIGGDFQLSSVPGEGTRAVLTIPNSVSVERRAA